MADILIHFVNEAYMQVRCPDQGILYELSEHFMFAVPGARYDPRVKARMWDGNIRLLNTTTGLMYLGLLNQLMAKAKELGYEVELDFDNAANEFSRQEALDFIATLDIPEEMTPRDYQVDGFVHAVRNNRAILLLATGGGKSLLAYLLVRFYAQQHMRSLIIVPTGTLVNQLYADFEAYGMPVIADSVHRISYDNGSERNSKAPVQISTWQSIQKMPASWFSKFGAIFGDEGHQYKSDVLRGIMERATEVPCRFALTGTLDYDKIDPLVVEGLFGPVEVVGTLKTLTDENFLSQMMVKCVTLHHPYDPKRPKDYASEIAYLQDSDPRNRFIRNLVLSLNGNTLVLFNEKKHGERLMQEISEHADGRDVFLVYGKVSPKKREALRQELNKREDSGYILIASYGVFQLGVNVPGLEYAVITSPSKSKYRVLQSIGRMTRKVGDDDRSVIVDISDDLRRKTTSGKMNYTLDHFINYRIAYYIEQGIPYKMYNVRLNP